MSDLALAIKLTTEGGQIVVKELTHIGQAAGTTNKELVNTGAAGTAAKKGFDDAAGGANALNGYMNTLKSTAALVIGSFSAMQLIDKGDEWGQYAARIRKATEDTDEYAYVQQRMISSANDTFRAINETKESFIQMSPILRDMGYQLGQSIDIVDSFSSQLVINAANSDRASSAQAALAKSIQAGKIDADAWQSIFSVMPTVLDNITAATGKTGTEIRQLGVTGKLSITDLTNALLLSYEENRKAVEAMPTTVRDALQSFNTVFSEYIGWQNEAKGITADVADGIGYLAENFQALINVVGGAAIGALTLYTARTVIATKATVISYREKQIAAAQELRLAQAQVIQTQATLAQVTAQSTYATGSARVMAATVAHEAAVKKLTIAQAAHTTVARSLLGVLGGPVGLALMAGVAAVSFLSFSSSADDVKASLQELEQPFDSLIKKFKAFNNDQKAAALIKWGDAENEAVSKANKAFDDLLGRYTGVMRASVSFGESLSLANQLRDAKAAGEDLTPILERVGAEAGVSPERIQEWIKLAGVYADNKAAAEQAAKAIKAVKDASGGPDPVDAKPKLPTEENKELEKALLGVYNAQLLNATAVDAYGASLDGIDLELFKAEFIAAAKLPDDAAAAIKRFAAEAKTAKANLDIGTYSKELTQQIALLDIRLAKGQQEFEIQKALAQFTGADPARLTALQAELTILQQKQALAADKTTLEALTKENDLLMVRLAQGEKEYEIQKALAALKGADPAVLEAIEAELRLRQQLTEQITTSEEIASGAFSQALDDMTALSSAGQTFGDALTQAFGSVAQQINSMTAAQLSYNKQLDELSKKKKAAQALSENDPKRATELLNIQRTEARLSKENFQAQLGQFSALSGAASQMFGEQSKEREALHKLEMAFGVAEIAMSMQKAGANALTAITSAFSAPFPLNFAAGAAMIAIMAGLGVFSGGSSASVPSAADRQASQGTGTVFGDSDAKSESIANALERIESLELDQYVELREINANIKSLSAGIANLAVSLVGNYGKFNEDNYGGELGTVKRFGNQAFIDFTHKLDQLSGGIVGAIDKLLGGALSDIAGSIIGGISKTTKKLIDSGISFDAQELGDILATGLVEGSYYNVVETTKRKLWGLSKKTKQSTEYTALDNALETEFGRIFSSIGNSITAAVDMLGLDTTKLLENFVIDLPALSFKDLSGDEIQAELEAIFSAQADLMVQYLVPAIGEYQQMGEGLYETLIRVAQEQAVFNAQLDALGLGLSRFGDVAAETQIAIAQSIIELMGGIDEFRDATSQYFASFYDESEQFAYLSSSLSSVFADLGVALPASRDGFRAIIDGIDLTTEAGQALYAALMALVPGLDEYFKAMERQTEAADKAAEAERKLAEQRAAYNAGNLSELARFDMSPLQLAIDDLNEWYQNAIKEAEELGADTGLLTSIYARRKENLAEKTLQQAIDTANTAMTRLVTDYERASGALQSTLQQQTNAINGMVSTIAGTISSIQQTLPGFDNVAFLRGRVSELAGGVGSGSIDEQLSKAGELQQAIQARYNAELAANRELQSAAQGRYDALASELNTLQSDFESAGNALRDAFDQVVDRIAGAAKGVAQTATQIRLSMPGADAAGYYASLVGSLRGQLGSGDIDSQLMLVSELQQAIQARYNAELQQLEQVQQVADEQYQLQLDQYNTALSTYRELAKAAEALRDAAAALQIGDLSPLTTGERLRETQSQLQDAMRAALSGDANAYSDVQQLGQRYLELARDFNPASYQGAFDYITGLFDQLGGTTATEPTAPRPHADTTRYEQEQISLAQAALAELAQLQQFTQALEATAANTLHNDLTALESTYNANTAAVNAQMQQLQDELAALEQQQIVLAQAAISELAALQSTVAGLQTLANTEYAAGVEALKAQFAQDSAAITASFETSLAELTDLMPVETDRVVAKLQEQIDALYQMGTDISGAIRETPAQTPDVVVNVPEIVVPPVVFPPELIDSIIKRPPDGIYPDPNPILSDIRDELAQYRQQPEIVVTVPPITFPIEIWDPLINGSINAVQPAYPDPLPLLRNIHDELQQQRQQTAQIAERQQFLQEQQNQQMAQLTVVTERFGREVIDLSNEQLDQKRSIA
ncbi:tape measure protein [Rheinheimera maricola]|uniref:Tape measure protein n=1 Tax=Rheinheimera maricola TaxID=2793282 RepID=A0ABS7X5I7_9GAMM|nr:tape measure protein [Rheinheimera maricola]MBZ9610811.1 tape measure protein [Rheinheimera maricola]